MEASLHKRTPKAFMPKGDRWYEMQKVFKGKALRITVPDKSIPGPGMYEVHNSGSITAQPERKVCTFGSQAHTVAPTVPTDDVGPGKYEATRAADTLMPSKPRPVVGAQTRDGRAKLHFPGAPVQLAKDTPGAGEYSVKDDWVKPSVSRLGHSFGRTGHFAGAAKPDDVPGPGAYQQRRAVTAVGRSRSSALLALTSPVATRRGGSSSPPPGFDRRPSRAGAPATPASHPDRNNADGGGDGSGSGSDSDGGGTVGTWQSGDHDGSADSRPVTAAADGRRGTTTGRGAPRPVHPKYGRVPYSGGVYRQPQRNTSMKIRDKLFRREARRRAALHKPRKPAVSRTLDATAAFQAVAQQYISPKSRKEMLREEAETDPFTTLSPAKPMPRGKHRFGATCHEVPLVKVTDTPGPGEYKVPGTMAAEDAPDWGVLLVQARSPKKGVGFPTATRGAGDPEIVSPGPTMGQTSTLRQLPEFLPKSTFGGGPKNVATLPKEGPGPGTYDNAKSTLKLTAVSAGAPKHTFGATCHDLPYHGTDIPGPTLAQISTFKVSSPKPNGSHTFGSGHVGAQPTPTPGCELPQQSALRLTSPSRAPHTMGSAPKMPNKPLSDAPGPGQYHPKVIDRHQPTTPFGGKSDIRTEYRGPAFGIYGQYGPSEMTHGADKARLKSDRNNITIPKAPRDVKPHGEPGVGPGAYGPDVAESQFVDPSLSPSRRTAAARRTTGRQYKPRGSARGRS